MVRNKLRTLRKAKGITQTYLSAKLGYRHPSGYSNIENGRSGMSLEQGVVIAAILGVSVDDLAEETSTNFFFQKLHETCKTSA